MNQHLLVIENRNPRCHSGHDLDASEAFISGARSESWIVHRLDAARMLLCSADFQANISESAAIDLIHATGRLAIIAPLHDADFCLWVCELLGRAARSWANRSHPTGLHHLQMKPLQFIFTLELPEFLYRKRTQGAKSKEFDLPIGSFAGFAPPQTTFVAGTGSWCAERRAEGLREVFRLGAGRAMTERHVGIPSILSRAA
jgi:hypothetical protein